MYMEEQVGTEHRLVLYADGSGELMHGFSGLAAPFPPARGRPDHRLRRAAERGFYGIWKGLQAH
jgi:hypothetical protein